MRESGGIPADEVERIKKKDWRRGTDIKYRAGGKGDGEEDKKSTQREVMDIARRAIVREERRSQKFPCCKIAKEVKFDKKERLI